MTEHHHPDPTALHLHCDACIERMREDQRLADLAEAGDPELLDLLEPESQPSLLDVDL